MLTSDEEIVRRSVLVTVRRLLGEMRGLGVKKKKERDSLLDIYRVPEYRRDIIWKRLAYPWGSLSEAFWTSVVDAVLESDKTDPQPPIERSPRNWIREELGGNFLSNW